MAIKNYKKAKEINPFENKYSLAITAIAQEMAKAGDTEYRRQEFESSIRYYKNAICVFTKKFHNKNINKFYLSYLRKYKNLIFKNTNYAFLITISFPKKGSSANSLSLINIKDF